MLGFQHAADGLLLHQQAARHSCFARMHMLFLGAGGQQRWVVLLRLQHDVVLNQHLRDLVLLQACVYIG